MDLRTELADIDLVWWPTFLRSATSAPRKDKDRFTACLSHLAAAIASEEE